MDQMVSSIIWRSLSDAIEQYKYCEISLFIGFYSDVDWDEGND